MLDLCPAQRRYRRGLEGRDTACSVWRWRRGALLCGESALPILTGRRSFLASSLSFDLFILIACSSGAIQTHEWAFQSVFPDLGTDSCFSLCSKSGGACMAPSAWILLACSGLPISSGALGGSIPSDTACVAMWRT